MKKVVYLSMAFLSFLLVLTGCGKKDDKTVLKEFQNYMMVLMKMIYQCI